MPSHSRQLSSLFLIVFGVLTMCSFLSNSILGGSCPYFDFTFTSQSVTPSGTQAKVTNCGSATINGERYVYGLAVQSGNEKNILQLDVNGPSSLFTAGHFLATGSIAGGENMRVEGSVGYTAYGVFKRMASSFFLLTLVSGGWYVISKRRDKAVSSISKESHQ